MKEYNIKLLVDNDKATFIFDCDKEKNMQCNKRNCSKYCNYTTDSKYMRDKAEIFDNDIIIDKPSDIVEYSTTNIYADNKVVRTIIDYKYE